MRTSAAGLGRRVLRAVLPSLWYIRGWLMLAKCLYFLGVPAPTLRRVLAKDGLLWNGWDWLYGEQP